jgi:hypothetical protein
LREFAAERDSFRFQADRFIEGRVPSNEELEVVFSRMDILYNKIRTPDYLNGYDRERFRDLISTVIIPQIKREASPGTPYADGYKTNGAMIDGMGDSLVSLILDRIENIMNWDGCFNRRTELVDLDLMDPVRLFIKNEPHTLEKCKMGRFRLIMSVSIVDKIIEMVFNMHTNKQQIADWQDIPSKAGMGFTLDMAESIYNTCREYGLEKLASADISGWDWSVKQWLLKAEVEYRIRLQTSASKFYKDFLRKKVMLDSNSIYQFSDGRLVQCNFSGLQNSGKYNTSSGNSIMRIITAFLVGSNWGIAMGDDCIESSVLDAQSKYLDLGFRCKMYEPIKEEFEFCSHIFTSQGAYALNVNKGLMRLLQNDTLDMIEKRLLTMQFEDDIAACPTYKQVMDCLHRVGWYAKICQRK